MRRPGRQHHQPVEAQCDAACRGHLRQRREEILVQRVALAVDAPASRPSRPRSGGAARPGRSARRNRSRARPRRHRARSARRRADRPALPAPGRPRRPDTRTARSRVRCPSWARRVPTSTRLKHVGPGVVGRDAHARAAAAATNASRSSAITRRDRSRRGARRPPPPSAAPGRQRDRPRRSAPGAGSSRRPRARPRQDRDAVVHDRLIGLAGAIPFQHGEFGRVQRPCARGCGRRGRSRRSASRLPPAASSSRIRARCAGSGCAAGRPCHDARCAKACRCASLPGRDLQGRRPRPRRSPARANQRPQRRLDPAARQRGTAGGRRGGRRPTTEKVCTGGVHATGGRQRNR